MEINYLVENKKREHEILERLDQFLINIADFLISLGISPAYSWYLIEIQTEQLVPSVIGEVDILAGKLEAADPKQFEEILSKFNKENPDTHPSRNYQYAVIDLAWNGGLKWIPSLDYLVGIEVKCCYLPQDATEITEAKMKSRKASPSDIKGIRKQVDKLLNLGFDKVGLFEFIVTPPSDGIGSQPWFRASGIARDSLQAMTNILEGRLPENSPAAHGACSFGGVLGREEWGSGASSNIIFREAQSNPHLLKEEIKNNRREMEGNLAQILQTLPQPRVTPAIFFCDQKTKEIRFVNEGVIRC